MCHFTFWHLSYESPTFPWWKRQYLEWFKFDCVGDCKVPELRFWLKKLLDPLVWRSLIKKFLGLFMSSIVNSKILKKALRGFKSNFSNTSHWKDLCYMHFTIWVVHANITIDTHLFPKALYSSNTQKLSPQWLVEQRTGK